MRVLVTGAAGFIGAALCQRLSKQNLTILGIDNLNSYYDVSLKQARLNLLEEKTNFQFERGDISDGAWLKKLFSTFKPQRVVHLAAQAGVRYSLTNPEVYIQSNIVGFLNILEECRHSKIEHLVYASSSSVYGANAKLPYSTKDNVDHPVSLYAASKKSNELMAHAYSHLYQIPTSGLRFFSVYGPWGRPDMAIFLFTKKILEGSPIDVFNFGKHRRDYTYIDDITEGVTRVLDRVPVSLSSFDPKSPDPSTSRAPYRLYNIGNSAPVWLDELIETLEKALDRKAKRNNLPMQLGDVLETYADVDPLVQEFDYRPDTPLQVGIGRFVDWYREYYRN